MSGVLLYVDPDADARAATADVLREATECEVVEWPGQEAAIEALDPAVAGVVTEFDLPDGTGAELLERLRGTHPDASFVLFTDTDLDVVDAATPDDAIAEYVPKSLPNAREELSRLVDYSVDSRTQTAYPLPDDEDERLAAVAAYEPAFEAAGASLDRLATLASDLLGVPMAAVGVVDEHEQSFLACYGVELGTFPREDTVCTYALLEQEVTAIPDLAEDPRFEDNEPLQNSALRAYASANLTTPDGHVVGTFCAYDTDPRAWTGEDRERLRLLAAEAMETLELRRRLHGAGDDDATVANHHSGSDSTDGGEQR